MAQITRYPYRFFLRSEASSHVLAFRGGRVVRSGRGISFWFSPDRTSIMEIPVDDRDTDFAFPLRTQDFQVVSVQGTATWRAADPAVLAGRTDFTVDLRTGRLRSDPLDRIANILIGLAQYQAARYVEQRTVSVLLGEGSSPLQAQMGAALQGSEQLAGMGMEVVTVRLAGITPTAELSRALETPTFEKLQERADEATFSRRALAVEKERAIAENELATKVELARRQAALIEQEDENGRRQAESRAAAKRIEAAADADRAREIGRANVENERAQLEAARTADPALHHALAARAFAERLNRVEHLNITPELAAALLGALPPRPEPPKR